MNHPFCQGFKFVFHIASSFIVPSSLGLLAYLLVQVFYMKENNISREA